MLFTCLPAGSAATQSASGQARDTSADAPSLAAVLLHLLCNRSAGGRRSLLVVQALHLEECRDLTRLRLDPVALEELALGGCSSLRTLRVASPQLQQLNLQCAPAGAANCMVARSARPRWHASWSFGQCRVDTGAAQSASCQLPDLAPTCGPAVFTCAAAAGAVGCSRQSTAPAPGWPRWTPSSAAS